jgi:hypothetical protein
MSANHIYYAVDAAAYGTAAGREETAFTVCGMLANPIVSTLQGIVYLGNVLDTKPRHQCCGHSAHVLLCVGRVVWLLNEIAFENLAALVL